jgi:hypothetical protein
VKSMTVCYKKLIFFLTVRWEYGRTQLIVRRGLIKCVFLAWYVKIEEGKQKL